MDWKVECGDTGVSCLNKRKLFRHNPGNDPFAKLRCAAIKGVREFRFVMLLICKARPGAPLNRLASVVTQLSSLHCSARACRPTANGAISPENKQLRPASLIHAVFCKK